MGTTYLNKKEFDAIKDFYRSRDMIKFMTEQYPDIFIFIIVLTDFEAYLLCMLLERYIDEKSEIYKEKDDKEGLKTLMVLEEVIKKIRSDHNI